jgi:hypothetical protein
MRPEALQQLEEELGTAWRAGELPEAAARTLLAQVRGHIEATRLRPAAAAASTPAPEPAPAAAAPAATLQLTPTVASAAAAWAPSTPPMTVASSKRKIQSRWWQ